MKKAERDRRIAAARKRLEAETERRDKFAAKAKEADRRVDQASDDIVWLEQAPIEDEPQQKLEVGEDG